jgi:RNA polymerase-binding transcription factor DksA
LHSAAAIGGCRARRGPGPPRAALIPPDAFTTIVKPEDVPMPTLTAAQLRELEATLVAEQARLERFVPREVHAHADAGGPAGDPGDELFPVAPAADARLDAVRSALDRLKTGAYGICTRCNSAIPYGRLIVMPESDHCVGCHPR